MFNAHAKQPPCNSTAYQNMPQGMYGWYNQGNYQVGNYSQMMMYPKQEEGQMWATAYNNQMQDYMHQHTMNHPPVQTDPCHYPSSQLTNNNLVPAAMGSPLSNLGSDLSSGEAHSPHMCRSQDESCESESPKSGRQPYDWIKKNNNLNSLPQPGKTRTKDKYRVVYSDTQRMELEKEFYYSRYITIRRKTELAVMLGLSERQVKIWFQNRRAKERKISKKREEPRPDIYSSPESHTMYQV